MSIMLQRIAHSSFDLGEVARGVQANIIRMNYASVGYPLFIVWSGAVGRWGQRPH